MLIRCSKGFKVKVDVSQKVNKFEIYILYLIFDNFFHTLNFPFSYLVRIYNCLKSTELIKSELKTTFSDEAISLIRMMIEPSASKRISANYCLRHPWFEKSNTFEITRK